MKAKRKEYKTKCFFCGKKVVRKYRLKKSVCEICKWRNYRYKKKGFRTKQMRNEIVVVLRRDGFTYKRIGKIFGISKMRVCQILKREKEKREKTIKKEVKSVST